MATATIEPVAVNGDTKRAAPKRRRGGRKEREYASDTTVSVAGKSVEEIRRVVGGYFGEFHGASWHDDRVEFLRGGEDGPERVTLIDLPHGIPHGDLIDYTAGRQDVTVDGDGQAVQTDDGDDGDLARRLLADRQLREEHRQFAEVAPSPWHSAALTRLTATWGTLHETYFGGKLTPPYVSLDAPGSSRRLGEFAPVSGFGGLCAIAIRPGIVDGTYKAVRAGDEYAEGRMRVAEDVLLHEMVHHYHHEVTGNTEATQHGHGPAFRDECNRIGALLGLPQVRSQRKGKRDADLPSCAHWPHNVRPRDPDYYLGAYVWPDDEAEPAEDDEPAVATDPIADAIAVLLTSVGAMVEAVGAVVALSDATFDPRLEQAAIAAVATLGPVWQALKRMVVGGDGTLRRPPDPRPAAPAEDDPAVAAALEALVASSWALSEAYLTIEEQEAAGEDPSHDDADEARDEVVDAAQAYVWALGKTELAGRVATDGDAAPGAD